MTPRRPALQRVVRQASCAHPYITQMVDIALIGIVRDVRPDWLKAMVAINELGPSTLSDVVALGDVEAPVYEVHPDQPLAYVRERLHIDLREFRDAVATIDAKGEHPHLTRERFDRFWLYVAVRRGDDRAGVFHSLSRLWYAGVLADAGFSH